MTTRIIPGFHGRAEELAWLRGLWDACTTRDASTGRYTGGPRMAVVVAESGIGKSRLVQALYQQLTIDSAWDPPEVNYWPDAFQTPGDSMRVNPDPHGHEPKGPPRFLWLGLRWQTRDVRNIEERTCRLPEARDALRAHVAIADRYRTTWEHARANAARAVRTDGAGETFGQVADAVGSNWGVPFGGLLLKLAHGAVSLVADRTKGERQLSGEQESQHQDAAEEFVSDLREVFGGPGSAGRVLPTVLWLDDAQWIDATTLRCLQLLWAEARRHRWPLFVVVTHWEREWRELLKASGGEIGADLPALARGDDADVRVLGPAEADALDGLVLSRLPGLTVSQRQLLLQKSGGNFLSMVENLGELFSNAEAFEGGTADGPLNPAGESFVREWESERQQRIEQRFSRLASEVKTLLGWGSALGVRFLREVVEDYAARALPQQPASEVLSGCVDPYAILGTPSPYVREFRDRAFHAVARKHFDRWGGSHALALHAVLREHLVRWVNGSFDDSGLILRMSDEPGWEAPAYAAIFLDSAERRDLLRMATEELPLPEVPDWTREADVAALRARVLLAWTDEIDHLYGEVRTMARELESVGWTEVPVSVLARRAREILASDWERAGALSAALVLFTDVLSRDRRECADEETLERLRDVSVSLSNVGNILKFRGDMPGALARYEEGLGIAHRLLADEETPDRLRDVSCSLINVGNILERRGDMPGALARYEESLVIARRLLADEETPDRLRDVSVSLINVGNILESRGDMPGALARYEESLGIRHRLLADEETPDRLRDVSVSLSNVGNILKFRGDMPGALARHEESLGIAHRLLADEETPDRLRDVSCSLNDVGNILESRGDMPGALARYEESLGISRRLLADEETPQRLRDVSVSLDNVGNILKVRGDIPSALARYEESLGIRHRLLADEETPERLRDVSLSLDNVGSILESRGDMPGALALYVESLGIRHRLLADEETPERRRDVSVSLERVARVLESRGDTSDALERYEESLLIARKLLEDEETPERRRDVRMSLERVGRMLESCGDTLGALERYEESLLIARKLLEDEETPEHRRDVSQHLDNVGNILVSRGDTSGALERYEDSLVIRRQLLEDKETPERLRDVSLSLDNVGSILESRDDTPGALALYEESLGISRRLLADEETSERLRDVSVTLIRVGNILDSLGDTPGALALYEESVGIARRQLADEETPDRLRDVSVSLINVGNILESLGDTPGALARYEESLGVLHRLPVDDMTLASLNTLLWVVQLCAGIDVSRCRADAALVRLDSVLEQVCLIESTTDVGSLEFAAAYWECRTEALEALGRSVESTECRSRALALRASIAEPYNA